ncbi:MAG: trigger factor [Clostridiales bacterium]|nr:trigger factor [Clostridiales bacterium]
MDAKLIKQEGYVVDLEMTFTNDEFKAGIVKAYNKTKGKYTVQGFRKGKAPQVMIERAYGEGIFYEEAINILYSEKYEDAVKQLDINPVDYPSIDIKSIGKDEQLVITAKVDVYPEVALGEYKGVEVEKVSVRISQKDVQEVLDKEAEKNSRMVSIEDRPAKKGDITIIDFDGFVNDVPFEGGKGENHELTLGSNQFIPGFEEQIIGKNVGDKFDVNVSFPEEYHAENLKGQKALFVVTLHEIKTKELPEIDDEFTKDISEFDTLEEYKKDIKKNLTKQLKEDAKNKVTDQAIQKATDNAKVDVPNALVERRVDSLMQEFGSRLQQQGMDIKKYAELTGMTEEQFREQYKEIGKSQVKTQLVIEAISKKEDFLVTDEEYDAKVAETAKTYNMELEEFTKTLNDDYKEYFKEQIVSEKTVEYIYDNAKQVATPAKKESKDAK